MHRISSGLLVMLVLSTASPGCGEGKSKARLSAPGEGALPSGGKPSTNDSGGSGGAREGSSGVEPAAGGATAGAENGGVAGAPPDQFSVGTELRIDVGNDDPTFVQLSTASEVQIDGDYKASNDWDLVFQGWDLFTNGGASGGGKGAAFGPLPFTYFWAAKDPTDVPFLIADKTAGAFRDWYFYDGQWHALYSRFHTYGVKSGGRLFKVQLLGYYGDVQGAPISALYQLCYAEVTRNAVGAPVVVKNLDATAGGLGGSDSEPGTCLTLATGEQQALTPSAALESSSWDLCFRRDAVTINGGLGGPGGVTAVDLNGDETESEKLDAIKLLTAASEAASFEAIDYDALTKPSLTYHGDRIVSAFTDAWIDRSEAPPTLPEDSTWLVIGADGKSRYLLGFTGLKHSTAEAAGTVVMRIRQVR